MRKAQDVEAPKRERLIKEAEYDARQFNEEIAKNSLSRKAEATLVGLLLTWRKKQD